MNSLKPKKTQEEIVDEANREWVPGTVYLVDIENNLEVQHNGKTDIVLIPQPSDDPNDPLLWSQNKKISNLRFYFIGHS